MELHEKKTDLVYPWIKSRFAEIKGNIYKAKVQMVRSCDILHVECMFPVGSASEIVDRESFVYKIIIVCNGYSDYGGNGQEALDYAKKLVKDNGDTVYVVFTSLRRGINYINANVYFDEDCQVPLKDKMLRLRTKEKDLPACSTYDATGKDDEANEVKTGRFGDKIREDTEDNYE